MTAVRSARHRPSPATNVQETPSHDEGEPVANPVADATSGDVPTFVVVDDERGILDAYEAYLSPQPAAGHIRSARRDGSTLRAPEPAYRLILAETGERAVDLVAAEYERGGVVQAGFFDMKMPGGIDGLETIRRIREIDPRVLCVIVTAYQDRSLEDIAAVMGSDNLDGWDYLNKPFTANEIIQKARNVASSWQRRRGEESQSQELETAVVERTRALAEANRSLEAKNRQIAEALREIEESNQRLLGEMHERERVETELRLAQKLEAVGQLAAGIAHEINTPMQYIGDNLQFLKKAFGRLHPVISQVVTLGSIDDPVERGALIDAVLGELSQSRMAALSERIPRGIDGSLEGVAAVTRIVRAMKDFSHPGTEEKQLVDLNRAIDSSMTVTRNEWKYVAEVDFTPDDDLPLVMALPAEINQVLLNLIVNAAQAIEDSVPTDRLGTIAISTSYDDEWVRFSISDDGIGIPDEVVERIFVPFFTTKPVGRGTGQGLAIVRSVVVDRHGGRVDVDSTSGEGSTFTVALPRSG